MSFFGGKISVFKSGSDKPVDLSSSCCFGILPEYDYLLKKQELDDAFVMEQISKGYGSGSNHSMIKKYFDYIRKSNDEDGKKKLIVLNLDHEDALVFNEKAHLGFDARVKSLYEIGKEQYQDYNPSILPENNGDIIDDNYCEHKTMGDKEICFVSLSRIEPFLIEKEGLNQKIEPHQISEFILLHENGHRLDPCFNDEKNTDFLNEHQSEVFADTYASIKFLTMNDNPELIGYMSDYRNNGFIEDSYKMVTNIDKVSKDDAETAVKYYTSPAINEVLKTYKEDKKSFENLDDKAIIEMAKTITLSKSLPKEKCDSFIKGILDKNVPDEISDALNQSMKNLKIASFTAVKNDTETKNANKENINSKLFANLDKSLKQDISYDMAFLNAYVETTKEITQNSSNMEKNIENLRKLLGQKNNLKSDYAFNDYYKSIKEPLFFEQIEGKNAVDYYMAVKLRYVKNIIPVLQDIKSGKITDQTISKFKASLKYSKYSHLMAKKAEEYIKSNPDYVPKPINDDIKYDSENIAPPTMHNIFKNNQRVLRNATAKFNSDIMKQALNSRKVKR